MAPRDPYRYFRVEAREILDGLNQGVLELERGKGSQETVKRLQRLAHTLKGAARVVRHQGLAELSHAVEEALLPLRAGLDLPSAGSLDALPGLMDSIGRHLAELAAAPLPVSAAPAASVEIPSAAPHPGFAPRQDTVRLETAELDSLLDSLQEARGSIAVLKTRVSELKRVRVLAQALSAGETRERRGQALELEAWLERLDRQGLAALEHSERELGQAHDKAARLRLLPAATLFDYLERVARDAATALRKKVRFETRGAEHRLDASAFAVLQEALQHVVRNAVVHGIELPSARTAAGKDPIGLVRVELRRQGGELFLLCGDDGGGIDTPAVFKAAGLGAPAGGAQDDEAAVALLLRGGLSTAPGVSELSGRGLGLETLRVAAEALRGSLRIGSRPGQGTEVEIRVPAALDCFDTLEVECGGVPVLLPFHAVRRVLGITPGSRTRSPAGDSIQVGDESLPYLPLGRLVGGGAGLGLEPIGVLLKAASGTAVLGVDRIVGIREAVVQPLPELTPSKRHAAGASLNSDGSAVWVFDPEGLVLEARASAGSPEPPEAIPQAHLLVVDDSLTTRMLEQSILETAGYRVDLASSAEEGLAKLREKRYGLTLVDVEMPGMNGFELLELLAADPALAGVPAILVTSRNAPEDRRRAAAAGAKDYIVKGEFDQPRLLGRIKELLS